MRCERFREAASARLDGEPIGMSAVLLDQHVASCPDCADWIQRATSLTRQLRLGTATVPDLTSAVMGGVVLPVRRVLRRRMILRIALLVAGLVQVGLSIPALAGESIGMHMGAHATHENAAWNLAVGVAFLATVIRPRRASGLVALLSVFTLALVVLCIGDLAAGLVTVDRLATHLAAVVGLVLLFAIDRAERALPSDRFAALARRGESGSGGPGGSGDSGESGDSGVRGVA